MNRHAVRFLLAVLLVLAASRIAQAQTGRITVKLVSDFDSARPVSELEEIRPITAMRFTDTGSTEAVLGERCVLWVRNAHIDGKFFFERFFQEKYIGRSAVLDLDAKELGAGKHTIQPGNHVFTLNADGSLASDDPDIHIKGNTVLLRMYRVDVFCIDASKHGPAEFRLVPSDVGVLALDPAFALDRRKLPDPRKTLDPRMPPAKGQPVPPLVNLLSVQKQFLPLSVWLPANQAGQGYLLYPSWQTFHVKPGGAVELGAGDAPRVPGVEAQGSAVVVPHYPMSGKVPGKTGLSAGVGSVPLSDRMSFGATLAPVHFLAGLRDPRNEPPLAAFAASTAALGGPLPGMGPLAVTGTWLSAKPTGVSLPIGNDLSRRPHKFFVADNSTTNREAIRLMVLEWDRPVLPRNAEARVGLRFLDNPLTPTLAKPEVRVSWSPYTPSNPLYRLWQPLKVIEWKNGELRFTAPDIDFQFIVVRVDIAELGDDSGVSLLTGEISGCIVSPEQQGSASFAANRGRTAFAAGEDVELTLILRSKQPRAAGARSVTLTHPDGNAETLEVRDTGEKWLARSLRIPAARTLQLAPGHYTLAIRDLPAGVVSVPFAFDLAGRQKPSLFHIVKPSKYTGDMNNLEPSHLRGKPIDLPRAMRTIAELGYTRVDHMAYMTNHHQRAYTWREELAAGDDRLPAPETVFTPTPRDQMLDACVRHQLQFADVWLSYGDFHLPRYIDPYIRGSERWMAREVQALRHSPAWDGLILYDEMYQNAAVGFVKEHATVFNKVRARLAEDKLGNPPKKIEEGFSRYLQRTKDQRDPKALRAFLDYSDWQQLGWKDYIDRVVGVGRELAPRARFGTYHRTWMLPGASDDLYNGYAPDLFEKLDIIGHIHYADNSTSWVSIPQMARILRTGQNKTLYVNMPIGHEWRTQLDGQYQRHMAFALLAQGANGISQWGMATTFADGPNTATAQARETTAHLNREILQPFGEIVDRTGEGYRKVGIVSTKNQMMLSSHKGMPTPIQTEGIWIACWRLGYPALFVREEDCKSKLEGYSVLFVPGVRFEGELEESVVKRLREAIAAGTRVVVEADSVLDLPGVTKLADWKLDSYFLGDNYFPTWLDDELNKVYEKSQPIVDYLRPKFKEWDIEPAASGPFKVGPSWRDGGQAQYLIMANFEDPDYGHTVKQQMAKPVLMPLEVAGQRGKVAYDLLAAQEVPLKPASGGKQALNVDMRRIQGAMIAFLPERVGKLSVRHAVSADGLRLKAILLGESGKELDAVFPVRLTLTDGADKRTFFRVLGRDLSFEVDLPRHAKQRTCRIEVREAISGKTAAFEVQPAKLEGPSIEAVSEEVAVPRAAEVGAFLMKTKQAVIVPGRGLADGTALVKEAQERLEKLGIKARIADENSVYHIPTGDPKAEDPLGGGYHSWHSGQEVIAPGMVVEEAVILLAGRRSSFLLDALAEHGYLTEAPLGEPGLAVRPNIQVAAKGLSVAHDTLCLIANESAGMRKAIERLTGEWKPAAPPAKPAFAEEKTAESVQSSASVPPVSFMGTNELVMDVQQDAAGNFYVITWGHGKNLYSLTPDGKPRFSRHLPEMGANRLSVHADRLYVYTSAGARLYALSLDGKPLGQARMNMDPGPANHCDNYSLSEIDCHYLADKRLLFHNLGDRMRVLDDQYRIVAEWHGEVFRDRDVSDEVLRRTTHAFVFNPERTKIAQLESSWYFAKAGHQDREVRDTHLVVRDLAGKLLHEFKHLDNGFAVEARLVWPADAPGPCAHVKEERWAFGPELQLLGRQGARDVLFVLRGEACLVRQDRLLVYHDRFNHAVSRLGPFETIPTFAVLSPDGKHIALLDEYGQLTLHQTADGKQTAQLRVPENGKVLSFTADSQRLILGTFRGSVIAYGLDGKPLWQTTLAEHNDILGRELSLYDPAFPDHSSKLWPVSRDEAGELEKLVKLDVNRLDESGWKGPVVRSEGGFIKLGDKMIGKEISGFLGTHVTWVLDFHYRSATGEKAEMLAGLLSQSEFPDSVARRFPADDSWRYGRIVLKNGTKCDRIKIGFSAAEGEVLLDKVALRRVRFPSVNHLLYEPFHSVKPVMLENLLLTSKYNPFGGMKDHAPNRVLLPNTPTGSIPLLDSSYLQNGRLNDVTSRWYNQPPFLGQDVMLSMGLKEPRWVNMVALYFNAYDAGNVTPHFDVLASDLEAKTDRLVASIRHNGQVMRIVKFPPVRTSLVKVRLVNAIARLRTLSEIEVYGPLSGKEGTPGFDDPDGQNTYMGDFSRVDKRTMKLPERFRPPVSQPQTHVEERIWHAPLTQPLVTRDQVFIGRTYGQNTAHPLAEPMKELYRTRANGMGFTPYGTFYGGLLLRGGIDGKLYCLHPDGGAVLWSVALGERIFGCPVAVGEDVFLPCEKSFYQIDLASGGILKVVPLSGTVQGSLACDGKQLYLITDDGYLQGYSVAELRLLWKTPIAKHTDSTPAVDAGVVYLADQKGTVRAMSAADGRELWKTELGDEFSRCPVVSKDRIVLGCRGGTLAVLERAAGKVVWSRKVPSRFDYEPLLIESKLLYFKGKSAMLADLADGKEKALRYGGSASQPATPFTMPQDPVTSFGYYKGSLFIVERAGETWHDRLYVNHPWHPTGGTFFVLSPELPIVPDKP